MNRSCLRGDDNHPINSLRQVILDLSARMLFSIGGTDLEVENNKLDIV